MVARIIINNASRHTDKLYDYIIPEEMQVKAGSRVIVPFGRGNREYEGYIAEILPKRGAKNLKSILRIVGDGAVLDDKLIELAHYMRGKYLCGWTDIIHTIIPSGISEKPVEWIASASDTEYKQPVRQKIMRILSDNGGAMEAAQLQSFFDASVKKHLSEMISDGTVKREYRSEAQVRDKTLRIARLCVSEEQALDYIKAKSARARVQCAMLEILLYNEYISVADLVRFSEGTYNAVSSLVKKGMVEVYDKTVLRDPTAGRNYKKSKPLKLTHEQQAAKSAICTSNSGRFLLHGVTGSGKTEVSMQVIEDAVKKGKTAVMLVPEISLTPQTVRRFKERFGGRVAVYHSALSLGERYDEWKKMRDGQADIVIGARSAVFAPLDNIGVIIMDEEHEQSYKSEMSPRYHTRDIALFRAEQHGAVLVFASATPSVESYYKAKNGEYTLLELKERATDAPMPSVDIVDMRVELENGNRSMFSKRLVFEIQKNLERGEQTILFLNRRGFSTFVSCRACGFVAECPNCNISLTYHKNGENLRCHYCGYQIPNYTLCPACGSKHIRYFGGGTQKVEEQIHKIFPSATTLRMDVDTTSRKAGHEKILNEFLEKKIDILIGTQMVTKGLDFPNVTLVGVVSADTMLNIDDFRSGERAFAVLEQVSGRAGRADKPGRAIIQTYTPEHDAVQKLKTHNYKGFFENEINVRKMMWYPPFSELVSVLVSSVSHSIAKQASQFFTKQLAGIKEAGGKFQILGPIPASISKIKNQYRFCLLIKCECAEKINTILTEAAETCYNNRNYKDVSIVIDKNPNHMN